MLVLLFLISKTNNIYFSADLISTDKVRSTSKGSLNLS